MDKKIKFKSSLHREIFINSDKFTFLLTNEELSSLSASQNKLLTIQGVSFQIVAIPNSQKFVLFRLIANYKEKNFEFKDKDFYLRGVKRKLYPVSKLNLANKTLTMSESKKAQLLKSQENFVNLEKANLEKLTQDSTGFLQSEQIDTQEIKDSPESILTAKDISDSISLIQEEVEIKPDTVQEESQQSIETLKTIPKQEKQEHDFKFKSSLEIENILTSQISTHNSNDSNGGGNSGEDKPKQEIKSSSKKESKEVLVSPEESLFLSPVNLEKKGSFWFTLNSKIQDSDKFFNDLRLYYFSNPLEINTKIGFVNSSELPPVFSRSFSGLNLKDLNKAFADKISARVDELQENKNRIEADLIALSEQLSKGGDIPTDHKQYQELLFSKKSLQECIERARNAIAIYSKNANEFKTEAQTASQKFFINIHGNPEIISRYYEKVTEKLFELNEAINEINQKHIDLENLIVRRLKEQEAAKNAKEKVRKLAEEEALEAFREDNKEFFDSFSKRDRKDFVEKLGELSESTAEIYRNIAEEKKKIQYYIDNLSALEKFEDYEISLYEHKKKERKLRREADEFNRHVYKLKLFLDGKEKKFDDFFDFVDNTILDFQKEVAQAFNNNDTLAKQCLDQFWDKWNEGKKEIDVIYTRTEQIVEALSTIPPLQIIKLYNLSKKLREEALDRQREWDRVYEEIKKEFRELGYELPTPAPSELDKQYLDKIENATFKLSEATQRALFIPKEFFMLSEQDDPTIGLNPKFMDDDKFAIIDQVWTKLSPEQEEEFKKKFNEEKQEAENRNAKKTLQILKKEQLKKFGQTFVNKFASMERYTNLFTSSEKESRMKVIENNELKLWKDEHYLISNSRGEFKDTLYNITKKLFSNKSVTTVNSDLVFTNDGLVDDGKTQIFTAKDFFIKPEDANSFLFSDDEVELREDERMLREPDESTIDLISDAEYLDRARDKFSPEQPLHKPTFEELAQICISKYKQQGENFDVELLREKLYLLSDEIKLIKEYHSAQSQKLDSLLSEKTEMFKEMQKDLASIQEFLNQKENELEDIISKTEEELDISLAEINNNLFRVEAPKPSKSVLMKWFDKLMYGEKLERK